MSFSQGLSGLTAASSQLDVIGNNVANANTVGFKSSQAQFSDVYAAALSGGGNSSTQTGIGVKLQTVAQQFSEGNISTTNSALDLAINGSGFFILNNAQGTSYSRNGQFELNNTGFVVDSTGSKLLGYQIDPISGKPVGSPSPLTIPTSVASATATGASTGAAEKGIVAGLNLNSSSLPPLSAFNPTDPTTFNNSTSTTTYDSKGVAQTSTMYFVKQSVPMNIAAGGITSSAATPPVTTVALPAPTSGLTVGQSIVGTGFPSGTTIASVSPAEIPTIAAGNISTVAGVSTVTVPNTGILAVGETLTGTGFPAGTKVATIVNGTTFTTTNAYTGPANAGGFSTSAVVLTTPVTSFTTSNAYTGSLAAGSPAETILGDIANTWQVYTTVTDPTSGASIFPLPAPAAGAWVANGILAFGANGTYSSFLPNNAGSNPYNAAGAQNGQAPAPVAGYTGPDNTTTSISFTPAGASTETIPFDFSTSTQFGAAFGVNKLTQDGFTAGQLSGFSIGTDGTILGKYSNGVSKPLGQVALATFPDNQGLQPVANNGWVQTAASGSPVVGAPGTGNNGVLQTDATEDSNVNLTSELVSMITAQRYYQANAQTIKTQDSVMQTLISMR